MCGVLRLFYFWKHNELLFFSPLFFSYCLTSNQIKPINQILNLIFFKVPENSSDTCHNFLVVYQQPLTTIDVMQQLDSYSYFQIYLYGPD